MKRRAFTLLFAATVLSGSPSILLAQEDPPGDDRPLYDPDSILVRFDLDELAKLDPIMYDLTLGLVGGESEKQYRIVPGLELIRLNKGELKVTVEEAIERLKILPYVKYVEPDYYLYPLDTPNDPCFVSQWALHSTGQSFLCDDPCAVPCGSAADGADINAPEAWDIITSTDIRIAVIDTGAWLTHPDLDDNLWRNPLEDGGTASVDDDGNGYVDDVHGYYFPEQPFPGFTPGDPTDPGTDPGLCPASLSHGTMVASTIGAEGDNSAGVSGVIWDAQLVILRIYTQDPNQPGLIVSTSIDAIDYCEAESITISNNSYGYSEFSQSHLEAIEAIGESNDHLFIAGAGNSGNDSDIDPVYPAAYDLNNIISVAAIEPSDVLWENSNFGLESVDLAAPGVLILNADRDYCEDLNVFRPHTGTSFAAPLASAACALVWELNPTWDAADVKAHLIATVRPNAALSGKCVSGGVLDLAAAVGHIPTAPSGLAGTANGCGSGKALLDWTDNSHAEHGFEVQREKWNGSAWVSTTLIDVAMNAESLCDTPGSSGLYRYRVRAINSIGNSSWSATVQITL